MTLSTLLSKRIPTILGLLFLGAGLAVGILVVGNGTGGFFPKASPETTPKQIKITNVSDTSFSVSFLTDTAVPGYLKYGTAADKLDQRIADDRDQLAGTVGEYTTHHITVRNLTPATTYYFEIGTASKTMYSDGEKPYSVKTAQKLGGSPAALTVYGNVVTSASAPAKDSIVYVTVGNSAPLSSLVKSTGSWAIPISNARTTDFASYIETQPTTPVSITVQGKDAGQTQKVETTVGEAQPTKTITLGGTTKLSTSSGSGTSTGTGATEETQTVKTDSTTRTTTETTTENQLNSAGKTTTGNAGSLATQLSASPSPIASPSPSASPATGGTALITSPTTVSFSNPSKEAEILYSTQPELRGTAPANTTINIKVESDPVYTDTITTDATGNWSFTPPAGLAPGEHTVTINYTDSQGVPKSLKRTFIVLADEAAGASGLGSSTIGGSSLPAIVSTPSATPKTTPSPTPKARVSIPATGSAIPKSGSTDQTVWMLFAGFAFVGVGLFLWNRSLAKEKLEVFE